VKRTLPTHNCAAPGCNKVIPGTVLMCYPHWALVPLALRQRVTRAWLDCEHDPFDVELRRIYNEARAKAIASVT